MSTIINHEHIVWSACGLWFQETTARLQPSCSRTLPSPPAKVNGEDTATRRLTRLKSNMIAFYVHLPSRLNLETFLFLGRM